MRCFSTRACRFARAVYRPNRVLSLINQVVKLWSNSQSAARGLLLLICVPKATLRGLPSVYVPHLVTLGQKIETDYISIRAQGNPRQMSPLIVRHRQSNTGLTLT